jgi:hypothetical protein
MPVGNPGAFLYAKTALSYSAKTWRGASLAPSKNPKGGHLMAKDLDTGYFDSTPSSLAGGFADLAGVAREACDADSYAAMDLEFEEDPLVREVEDREDMQDLIELSLHMND